MIYPGDPPEPLDDLLVGLLAHLDRVLGRSLRLGLQRGRIRVDGRGDVAEPQAVLHREHEFLEDHRGGRAMIVAPTIMPDGVATTLAKPSGSAVDPVAVEVGELGPEDADLGVPALCAAASESPTVATSGSMNVAQGRALYGSSWAGGARRSGTRRRPRARRRG